MCQRAAGPPSCGAQTWVFPDFWQLAHSKGRSCIKAVLVGCSGRWAICFYEEKLCAEFLSLCVQLPPPSHLPALFACVRTCMYRLCLLKHRVLLGCCLWGLSALWRARAAWWGMCAQSRSIWGSGLFISGFLGEDLGKIDLLTQKILHRYVCFIFHASLSALYFLYPFFFLFLKKSP